MSKQNQNQHRTAKTEAPAVQVNNTEETISGMIRDSRRAIKESLKGQKALEAFKTDPAAAPLLEKLAKNKQMIAEGAAKRVYEYLMRTEA